MATPYAQGTAANLADSTVARITVNLPSRVWQALSDLADHQNMSKTEALRRAITTYVFLMNAQAEGKEILLRKDGNIEQLVFQ